MTNNYNIYSEYIDELIKNENNTTTPIFKNLFTKQDYESILRPVLTTILENENKTFEELKEILFQKSPLKSILRDFNDSKITPGITMNFGTLNTRQTLTIGNMQEYNNDLIKEEIALKEDTIFDLASTSKLFTTLAILTLEKENHLNVFDKITKYVPQFKNLNDITIYDLLKFRVSIITDKRIDQAKSIKEANDILFTVYKNPTQTTLNAYTDMGAMVLKYVVESITNMNFDEYINQTILKKYQMQDTHILVPEEKLNRVANENFSIIIDANGKKVIRTNNTPGTHNDPKSIAVGANIGIAPGHAGYFSTTSDMIKLANAILSNDLITKEQLFQISDNQTGYFDEEHNKFARFYGSLVYIKQPDQNNLSVYHALSGRSFMSPGYAGTELVIDPLNKISLFIASPRLHNRIHKIAPEQAKNIQIINGIKTFDNSIVNTDYTNKKEIVVRPALDLALQYQLLEKIFTNNKEMTLVR